jgi:hypothetical protein
MLLPFKYIGSCFPAAGGIGFHTFFWKVMKIKNNPNNPVDHVQKK